MTTQDPNRKMLEENYAAFEQLLPTFKPQDNGKFALMRDAKLVNIFDTAKDAIIYAQAQFKDERYSVQQITKQVVDLGYFSHALPGSTV